MLTPFVWSALGALLLTYVLVAPLTTALTIVGVALVGLAASIPPSWTGWLPGSWAARLPINRWLAAAIVVAALTLISWSGIDAVDKRLRRLLAGADRRRRGVGGQRSGRRPGRWGVAVAGSAGHWCLG